MDPDRQKVRAQLQRDRLRMQLQHALYTWRHSYDSVAPYNVASACHSCSGAGA